MKASFILLFFSAFLYFTPVLLLLFYNTAELAPSVVVRCLFDCYISDGLVIKECCLLCLPRAWDAGVRPKTEEAAVRRVAERNALRCSLLRSEARKKQQPKVSALLNLHNYLM